MTLWVPDIEDGSDQPKYLAIADAIAADVSAGHLVPGVRLPPHRDLAQSLGVTVGTVSRAYAEARRRGLVRGEVGRGTFILEASAEPGRIALEIPEQPEAGAIDLSRNFTLIDAEFPPLARALTAHMKRAPLEPFVVRHPSAGAPEDREAGAQWMARFGVEASAEEVVVTCGVQHGLTVALGALCDAGDLVVAEALTYPGLKGVARLLGLRLEGLPMDDEGIDPGAFENVCKRDKPRALYCVPTIQNPTAIVVSERRRSELVDIAQRYDVWLIEDDTYAFLVEDPPPPLCQLAPDRTSYLTALSKSVLPGLRVGYVRTPRARVAAVADAVMATTWMPAPPMTAVATTLIGSGVVDDVARQKRVEAHQRNQLAHRLLSPHLAPRTCPTALHVWVNLPPKWRATDFAAALRDEGVLVTTADQFTVSRRTGVPQAIRACIGAPRSAEDLTGALETIRDLLQAR